MRRLPIRLPQHISIDSNINLSCDQFSELLSQDINSRKEFFALNLFNEKIFPRREKGNCDTIRAYLKFYLDCLLSGWIPPVPPQQQQHSYDLHKQYYPTLPTLFLFPRSSSAFYLHSSLRSQRHLLLNLQKLSHLQIYILSFKGSAFENQEGI